MSIRSVLSLFVVAGVLAGCTSVRPQDAFEEVREDVAALGGAGAVAGSAPVVWRTDAAEDRRADAAVDSLLAGPLTAEAAVAVALLNNRRLQATYEDLGVAQASLVQAGLLSNPVFGSRALWALEEGGAPDLGFSVAFEFLDVFYLPLRRAVARSEYEAARLRVGAAVVDLAARTRVAFYEAQAAAARTAMRRRVVANADAAYEAAVVLREAGNVPATALLAEQSRYEGARLDLITAEAAETEAREALVRLLGLYGPDALAAPAGELLPVEAPAPLLPVAEGAGGGPGEVDVAALEAEAVDRSLALAALRAEVEAFGRRLGLTRAESLLPELEGGGELEREEGAWKAGPEAGIVLPLFDVGTARRAAARAELRRRQANYYATAVEVRSAARTLAARLAAARRAAVHYQDVVLPLRADLVAETLRQYNAMQTGVFGLLQAQALEVDAAAAYLDALARYWRTRAELEALLAGGTPDVAAPAPAAASAPSTPDAAAH